MRKFYPDPYQPRTTASLETFIFHLIFHGIAPSSTAILIIIGLAGKTCYLQQWMSAFPNARIKRDPVPPGLHRNLLFCAKRRNYCIIELAEKTIQLFGKNIGNSTILLRDFVTQLDGRI